MASSELRASRTQPPAHNTALVWKDTQSGQRGSVPHHPHETSPQIPPLLHWSEEQGPARVTSPTSSSFCCLNSPLNLEPTVHPSPGPGGYYYSGNGDNSKCITCMKGYVINTSAIRCLQCVSVPPLRVETHLVTAPAPASPAIRRYFASAPRWGAHCCKGLIAAGSHHNTGLLPGL